MKIQDKACLVSLNISQWTARKFDKKATDSVADHYKCKPEAGRYNKAVIAREHLDEIVKISGKMRTYHYERTLPYCVKGQAILPSELITEYMGKYNEFKAVWDEAVEKFCASYPELQEEARIALNGLYNPADYPSERQLRRKFQMGVDFAPIPEGSHLKIPIGNEELKEMQKDIEAKVRDAATEAQKELWNRVFETVSALQERMTDDGEDAKTFRDSIVGNVKELAELLPKMNITEDPDLDRMAQELSSRLDYDPKELRQSKELRKEAREAAAEVLKQAKNRATLPQAERSAPSPAPAMPKPVNTAETKVEPKNETPDMEARLAALGII